MFTNEIKPNLNGNLSEHEKGNELDF